MALFGNQAYRVSMNSGEISITPYGNTKPDAKYIKRANKDAGVIVEALGKIKAEYDVTESIMNQDFIIEYNKSTFVSNYKGPNKEGLDHIELGVFTAEKRVAIHEGTHMAHRRAIEDLIEKDPEFVERFETNYNNLKIKDKRVPGLRVFGGAHDLIKRLRNQPYKPNGKSAEIAEKMWRENTEFCENFANKHADMSKLKAVSYSLSTVVGLVAYGAVPFSMNQLIELNNNMDVSDIIQTMPFDVITPVALVALGTVVMSNVASPVVSMVKNRNEKGLVPSYLNKEIKKGD